jgi:glycosyltransferase involved in cell wall biosynthesis
VTPTESSVSVIVPAYNAETTIERSLLSALGQSVPPLEIIVVDDGSTDSTPAILATMAMRFPTLKFTRQENSGVAVSRNAALSVARGSWIAPLDADDRWHPEKLARQLDRIDGDGGRIGLIYCWSVEIDENDFVTGHHLDLDRYENDVYAALIFSNFLSNASVPLIRRQALEQVHGWDSSLRLQGAQGCEDWDLYLRLAEVCNYALTPAFLVGYRQSRSSMSRDIGQMRRSFDLVLGRARAAHPELPDALFRWSLSAFNAYSGELLWQSGAWSEALRALVSAACSDPSWLVRRSTRKKLRRLLSMWLGGSGQLETALGQPAIPPVGRPFSELQPVPSRIETDGRFARRRKNELSSLRIERLLS